MKDTMKKEPYCRFVRTGKKNFEKSQKNSKITIKNSKMIAKKPETYRIEYKIPPVFEMRKNLFGVVIICK